MKTILIFFFFLFKSNINYLNEIDCDNYTEYKYHQKKTLKSFKTKPKFQFVEHVYKKWKNN